MIYPVAQHSYDRFYRSICKIRIDMAPALRRRRVSCLPTLRFIEGNRPLNSHRKVTPRRMSDEPKRCFQRLGGGSREEEPRSESKEKGRIERWHLFESKISIQPPHPFQKRVLRNFRNRYTYTLPTISHPHLPDAMLHFLPGGVKCLIDTRIPSLMR